MKSRLARIGVVALVAMAALAVAGVASAANAKPNLWLHVLPSPRTPLADATVTVKDATGRVVGTGTTSSVGVALLHVETGEGVTRPYTVTTSGGTTDGAPFSGHLELRTWRASMRGGAQSMDIVSTAAVRYLADHDGRVADVERRLFKGLGLSERFGHIHLKHSSRTVDRRTLNRHHRAHGGFDGSVAVLVRALEGTGAFPDLTSARHEKPRKAVPTSTRAAGGTSVPCGIQPAQESAVSNAEVTAASIEMIAGIATGFHSGDPALFLEGAIGMGMSQTPGSDVAGTLSAIEQQLACISGQIQAVQASVDKQSEAIALASAQGCESAITSIWTNEYQVVLQTIAAADPNDKVNGYYASNDLIDQLADDIESQVKPCNNIINQALFNGQNGQIAAWTQLLQNYRSGDYRSSDSTALTQQSVVELQQFLQYWGNLMYMQSVLVNEYYNIRINFDGKNFAAYQQSALIPVPVTNQPAPPPCPTTPSLDNVQPKATNGCQWQQNIANVWPGDVYTDEVLYFKNTTQSSPFGISGWGFSAVPVAWGQGNNTTPSTPVDQITPKYLADREIDKYDKRWNASAAVAYYNNLPATDIGGLNQSIYFRRGTADPDNIPWCNGNCGNAYPNLSVYGPFFSQWLNSAKPDPVNGSYATVNLAPGATNRPWQILAKDGTVVFDDGGAKCGKNYTEDGYYYAHYTSHNTIYSPKPWTANSGGTIGGGSTDPCSVTVPIAFLKARGVGQGTSWPAAPIITSTGTVASTATLAATGCPPGGCTWAISSPLASNQAGLQLSSGGTFSWPGAAKGATATVQVIAGSNLTYSMPVTLTVQVQ